ncbi:hypothetical protein D9758_013884 [Tetrapyrgos nigripes]|uniref:F-box protein n=1 Tax=Tetrapyrgos nigripes TaxID=182062 RepID=A0A8H5CRD9_9AGAR|nr:hypothetical protein D9758_013884 [Tetrapyrgos nigripes]
MEDFESLGFKYEARPPSGPFLQRGNDASRTPDLRSPAHHLPVPPRSQAFALSCKSSRSLHDSLQTLVGHLSRLTLVQGVGFLWHFPFYEFETSPTLDSWDRFRQHYSHRVFEFKIEPLWVSLNALIAVIAVTRPSDEHPIFPNIRVIHWNSTTQCFDAARMFMHETLEECSFRGRCPLNFVEMIPTKVPFLRRLDLSEFVVSELVDVQAITTTIQQLPHLTSLHLPALADISGILVAAGAMEKLEHLCIASIGRGRAFSPLPSPSCLPSWFPSLSSLTIVTVYQVVTTLLSLQPLDSIRTINVRSVSQESPAEHHRLFDAISRACPFIECVRVKCKTEIHRPPFQRVSFGDIQPLLHCRAIRDLSIVHAYALDLSEADVERLASQWRFLEKISLSPQMVPGLFSRHSDPEGQLGTHLGLRAVVPFIRYCPDIKEIGLFLVVKPIDSGVVDHSAELNSLSQCMPFRKLQSLDLGSSRLENRVAPQEVASFINQLLCLGGRLFYDKVVAHKLKPQGIGATPSDNNGTSILQQL